MQFAFTEISMQDITKALKLPPKTKIFQINQKNEHLVQITITSPGLRSVGHKTLIPYVEFDHEAQAWKEV